MVLASNKWLSNSGDDQKSSEVVASSNNDQTRANTADSDLQKTNFMSAERAAADTSSIDRPAEDLLSSEVAQTDTSESALINNANGDEQVSSVLDDQRQESNEQQTFLDNLSKAMASNKNKVDYAMNEETSFQDEIETSQITLSEDLEANSGEIENNNHAYTTLIDGTFNNMIVTGLESDSTHSNLNILNNDLSVKNPSTNINSTEDDNMGTVSGVSKKFLDTLKLSLESMANGNPSETIAMNNANAMPSNKPVNPVFALETVRPSILNVGNNSASNNNTHIVNGESSTTTSNDQAKIVLYCEQKSHPFQTRTIFLTPNLECKVGRLIAKCKASESNAIFDCKVLSRNHAVLWYSDDGKFWVKDTKSSNGTFINDNKLGNDAAELHYGDVVKFGVDVLENSRKEVHGCIIASVKLYFPDGRQAITIDSNSQRSQYSGESRISYDDLHRLNVYMQETSQREKALKSKLFNIQNLLDATRKNSSTCWQAMISEDQLLHRIHSLEKKIQILEKNMPENALKNELLKMIDDKSAYQHSAKEALRGVYLERCEAMKKLAKLDSDFISSENECKILRDRIICAEEAFHDVSERLRLLETDRNNYRAEAERQQLEAKMEFEERIRELSEKLKESEDKLSQLKCSDLHGEEYKLEKQAIENLDAVIAGMDIEDDDNDDNEDIIDEDASTKQQKEPRFKSGDVYDFNSSCENSGDEKKENFNLKESGSKIVDGDTTIMKWLKNSDLNRKEGSMDIFNAICNTASDSSDEDEEISPNIVTEKNKELKQRWSKLEKKMQNLSQYLKQYLKQLDIDDKDNKNVQDLKSVEDADIPNESVSDLLNKVNEQMQSDQISTQLKNTVIVLHTALEEILDNFKQMKDAVNREIPESQNTDILSTATQFKKINKNTISDTNVTLPEINEAEDEHDSEEDDENVIEILHSKQPIDKIKYTEHSTVVNTEEKSDLTETDLLAEINNLKAKLIERDRDSQQTLDMLQVECETHKRRVNELMELTESLRHNQECEDISPHVLKLPSVADDLSGDGVSSDSGVSSVDKTTDAAIHHVMDVMNNVNNSSDIKNDTATTNAAFEQEMREELAAINSSAVQREEELIAYKESLEQSQKENIQLRKDLLLMQKQPDDYINPALVRTIIPMGVAVVGVLAYLIITYF